MSQPPSILQQRAIESITNTLKFQNEAVNNLYQQYNDNLESSYSMNQLLQSTIIMYDTIKSKKGKIIISGIGKSYKIANKLVATLNSLSIQSVSLHPSEALHGDLGCIENNKDCLIMVTASGNTPELINLLPHLSSELPIILLTCNKISKLLQHSQISSLIYADLPSELNENSIHGLPAPTVSTTLSLILADATILALSEMLEGDLLVRKKMFSEKHPGGSIGATLSNEFKLVPLAGITVARNPIKPVSSNDFRIFRPLAVPINQPSSSTSSSSSSESLFSLGKSVAAATTMLATLSTAYSSNCSSDTDEPDIYINATPHPILRDQRQRPPIAKSIKIITYEEVFQLQELELLQWITIYDQLSIVKTNSKVDCRDIKNIYLDYCKLNEKDWAKFKWDLMKLFN